MISVSQYHSLCIVEIHGVHTFPLLWHPHAIHIVKAVSAHGGTERCAFFCQDVLSSRGYAYYLPLQVAIFIPDKHPVAVSEV
jgi:hypothetical protein